MSPPPTEAEVAQFSANVKTLVSTQDKIRAIAAQAKEASAPLKETFKAVEEEVMRFMRDSQIDVCNYQEDKIEYKMATRQGSLTRKTLKGALEKYFGEGNEEEATKCFEAVNDALGQTEVEVVRRKKAPKKKEKKAAPAKKRQKLMHVGDDDDNDDNDDDNDDSNGALAAEVAGDADARAPATESAGTGNDDNNDDDDDDDDFF